MLLSELISHPYRARFYLERYVNDGSPSGFSTVNTTSPKTSPFELTPWFHPCICWAPSENFRDYGQIPNLPFGRTEDNRNWIIVHPDMAGNEFFSNRDFVITPLNDLKVIPTASGRTVQILEKHNEDYIKLNYVGILGRVRRELPYCKAISGPEISRVISLAITDRLLDPKLSILPETGARVLINGASDKDQWGMVWRQNRPLGLNEDKYRYLFPAFSLFSMDRLNNHHYPILKQIIDCQNYDPEEYVLETILFPLINCYFDLLGKLGLQAELNSQNLLFGFDGDFSECSFVLRDLESVDKDLTLMKTLGLKFVSECYPYKCLEANQYNYSIKHSFMYDFKLGESILVPIINILLRYYGSEEEKLHARIREYAGGFIKGLPDGFFPENKWYVFDKVIVDQSKKERPYLEYSNPKFR